MWCQGRRADYSCCKSHWYAQTLGWSVCSHSDAHTRSRAHAQREIKTHSHVQPNVDMPNRDEHKSKQSIQTQKWSREWRRRREKHSPICQTNVRMLLTHTRSDAFTQAHACTHTHSRHHLVWTWAISAVVLSQSVLGGLSKSCMKVCLELSECVKLYESPWDTCWYTHTHMHTLRHEAWAAARAGPNQQWGVCCHSNSKMRWLYCQP